MILETIIFISGSISGLFINKLLNKFPKKNKVESKLEISENLKFSDIPNYWQYNIGDKILIAAGAKESFENKMDIDLHLDTINRLKNSKDNKNFVLNTYEAILNKISINSIEVFLDKTCLVRGDKILNTSSTPFFIKPCSILKNVTLEQKLREEQFKTEQQQIQEDINILKEIYEKPYEES